MQTIQTVKHVCTVKDYLLQYITGGPVGFSYPYIEPIFFLLYHAASPGVSVWSRSNSWEDEAGETQHGCVLGSSDKNLKRVHPYN